MHGTATTTGFGAMKFSTTPLASGDFIFNADDPLAPTVRGTTNLALHFVGSSQVTVTGKSNEVLVPVTHGPTSGTAKVSAEFEVTLHSLAFIQTGQSQQLDGTRLAIPGRWDWSADYDTEVFLNGISTGLHFEDSWGLVHGIPETDVLILHAQAFATGAANRIDLRLDSFNSAELGAPTDLLPLGGASGVNINVPEAGIDLSGTFVAATDFNAGPQGGEAHFRHEVALRSIATGLLGNGGFDFGGLAGWSAIGPGTASAIPSPFDATNYIAELVTGSPVTLLQSIHAPETPFLIGFDANFPDALGTLEVVYAGHHLATILAVDYQSGGLEHIVLKADQDVPAEGELRFTFDGPSGSRLWLDNIDVNPVPEPSTWALGLCGAMTLAAMARRNRVVR